jgi:small subunit ribosomal protein S5
MAEHQQKKGNRPDNRNEEGGSDMVEKLVSINRTTKVVKGGRRFGFAALVVIGDGKGRIGVGKGKAKEVADAKRKASEAARRAMIKIPMREGRTIHHDIKTKAGAGGVILRTAAPGTGIIAGGPMRAIFEVLGIKDVVAKSFGSSNPYNMVASTIKALQMIQSPKSTASRRGKKVNEIVAQRETKHGESAPRAVANDSAE